MKRGKKLVRNLSIIAVILSVFFYFDGYYLSKQRCVRETLRGVYSTETDREVMELRYGNYIATVMAEENGETYTFAEWKEDFAGYVKENHNWECATYKAYNAEGELVGEEIYY